jgi:hypothetical protein
MNNPFKKEPRWQWETKIWCFNFDISRFINGKCVSFGFLINWNFKPSIEADFLFWRFYLEYQP